MSNSTLPALAAGLSPREGSLEYWAETKPNVIAIHDGEQTLTWRDWNDQANRIAEALARQGVTAGDIVVVRTQIRTEWAIISSALAKLGCSLLGLNWRLTPEETAFVLGNSRADAMILDDAAPGALSFVIASRALKLVVSIDVSHEGYVDWSELLANPAVPRFSAAEAPLVIYTSGTTGLPKGVVMGGGDQSPERLLAYMHGVESALPRAADDVVLVTMPFSHGSGPAQVRGVVRNGSALVLMRRYDPLSTLAAIERHRVTVWVAVPTMIKRMAALPAVDVARYDVSSIRAIQVGAAPVTGELKEWILRFFGEHVLHEGYGSTEAGMITHMPPEGQRLKPGSSGKPYPLVEIEIRDSEGVALPSDTVGEIWVNTPVVIRAYLNAAPLDEETLDARGFFRTGDVGRVDRDGYLFITDRAKDMIVSGGVNIYPAEIEAALMRCEVIQDAAVIGIPDDEFGEQVKAFVELKPGYDAVPEQILNDVKSLLASYKRPKSIEIVGKLLKRELRAPYWQGRERAV
jgi:long-chain acyl-CoA synthetase